MNIWIIWFILAIVFLFLEIFAANYLFISIGIGALLAGIIAFIYPGSIIAQIIFFAIVSFPVYLWLRKNSKRIFRVSTSRMNISNKLQGKKGVITQEIAAKGKGYVRIAGQEWLAVSQNSKTITEGQAVKVASVSGNKLVVSPVKE